MSPINPAIYRRAWQLVLLLAVSNFAASYADIYLYPPAPYASPSSLAEVGTAACPICAAGESHSEPLADPDCPDDTIECQTPDP